VFGVLNMIVSIASLAPMIVAGAVADAVGVPAVILVVGSFVCLWGLASYVSRGALPPAEAEARAPSTPSGAPVDPITAALSSGDRALGSAADSGDRLDPAASSGSNPDLGEGRASR
jgi:hypothetical protein